MAKKHKEKKLEKTIEEEEEKEKIEEEKEEPKVDDKKELNLSRISVIVHTVIGIIAGYFSYILGEALYGIGIMIVFLLASGYLSEKLVRKKGIKWWLGNGGIILIFIWLVSWIYFLNMV